MLISTVIPKLAMKAVEALLQRYATTVANTAGPMVSVNVGPCRLLLTRCGLGMDEAASAKFGTLPENENPGRTQPSLVWLANLGDISHFRRQVIGSKQFMEQYKNGQPPPDTQA